METTYNIDDILFAITNSTTYEDTASLSGEYSWLDIVIDAKSIVEKAGLTKRQQQIFNMYYVDDLTLIVIGKKLGVSHQGVYDALKQSKVKIQRVLDGMEGDVY